MQIEKRSQKAEILNWLQKLGTITPKDAEALCGCMRLAARISDLRADGWLIVTEAPRVKGARYAAYRLLGRVEEGGPDNDTFK